MEGDPKINGPIVTEGMEQNSCGTAIIWSLLVVHLPVWLFISTHSSSSGSWVPPTAPDPFALLPDFYLDAWTSSDRHHLHPGM